MGEIDYDDRLHRVYDAGRIFSDDTLRMWMETLRSHVGPARPLCVLDLGSGTGRFSPCLAETFGAPVAAVEPSDRMRAVAAENHAHPRVTYIKGTAEAIPLPDTSVDVTLLFLVLHHLANPETAAREIARVTRPGGWVFIRSGFKGRLSELEFYRYFPRAREIDEARSPALDDVVAMYEKAGLAVVALDRVEHEVGSTLAEHLERLRHRAYSTFEYMQESEIVDGFAAMEEAVRTGARPGPVREQVDLLVLRQVAS